jgi:hypothetical protein
MGRFASQRGQNLVEFAVIFPIFAILLFMVIDGGLVMGRYNNTNQAAAEAARAASIGNAADVQAIVEGQTHGAVDDADPDTCTSSGDDVCLVYMDGPDGEDAGQVGSIVAVRVRQQYSLITPLPVGNPTWDIVACSHHRLERPITGVTGGTDPC